MRGLLAGSLARGVGRGSAARGALRGGEYAGAIRGALPFSVRGDRDTLAGSRITGIPDGELQRARVSTRGSRLPASPRSRLRSTMSVIPGRGWSNRSDGSARPAPVTAGLRGFSCASAEVRSPRAR